MCGKAPGAPDVPNSGLLSPQPGLFVYGVLYKENITLHRGTDTAGDVANLCSKVIARVPNRGHIRRRTGSPDAVRSSVAARAPVSEHIPRRHERTDVSYCSDADRVPESEHTTTPDVLRNIHPQTLDVGDAAPDLLNRSSYPSAVSVPHSECNVRQSSAVAKKCSREAVNVPDSGYPQSQHILDDAAPDPDAGSLYTAAVSVPHSECNVMQSGLVAEECFADARVPDSGHKSQRSKCVAASFAEGREVSTQPGIMDNTRTTIYVEPIAQSGPVNVKNFLCPAPISNVLSTGRQVASKVPVAVPSDGRSSARYESHVDKHQPVYGLIPPKRCPFLKIGLIIASDRADAAIPDFAVAAPKGGSLGLSHQEGVDKPHISRATLEIHHQRISWPTTGIKSGRHGALQPPNLLSSWWLVPPWPNDVNITMPLTVSPRTSAIHEESNYPSKTSVDLHRMDEQLLQRLCDMYLLYIWSALCIILRDHRKEIRPAKDANPRCSSPSIRPRSIHEHRFELIC